MPTYEYRCKDCGHTFDAYQSFTDDPLTECPECEGALKKVFGNVGIAFKGSGFYKTDSRAGAKAGASSSSGSDASKGGSEGSDSSATSGSKDTKGSDGSSSSKKVGAKDGGSSSAAASASSST